MPFEDYVRQEKLGEGTFGKVYRGVIKKTGRVVAIKKLLKVSSSRLGVELPIIREIMLLQELRQENIIELVEVLCLNGSVSLVFEYCVTDLEKIIQDRDFSLGAARIKGYMLGTLRGIAYCHESWVLHRDLKPGNLLLTADGIVKVADFGLARLHGSPERRYTGQVVTRWYRAPELLFGAKFYGRAVDLWSVGIIMAELLLRVPFLPGNSDIDQLSRVFTMRGTPTEETWPGVSSLPDYIEFQHQPGQPLHEIFTGATPDTLHLLEDLLTLDPGTRISAQNALTHGYFVSATPPPAPSADLVPRIKSTSKASPATDAQATAAKQEDHKPPGGVAPEDLSNGK
mmetsp:Transcript_44259/g.116323  ORF Transcript_44259/g.116323 Transcript_44259/m.116323 type:complete len:342 (+) Transcript_44259:132-1157(+)